MAQGILESDEFFRDRSRGGFPRVQVVPGAVTGARNHVGSIPSLFNIEIPSIYSKSMVRQ